MLFTKQQFVSNRSGQSLQPYNLQWLQTYLQLTETRATKAQTSRERAPWIPLVECSRLEAFSDNFIIHHEKRLSNFSPCANRRQSSAHSAWGFRHARREVWNEPKTL